MNWIGFGIFAVILVLLMIYKKIRIGLWRKILKNSIEYHKFHLSSINMDSNVNQSSRDLAHSMLWGVTKQLPLDIKDGKGGRALFNSYLGMKTSLFTSSRVFYECINNYKNMDVTIFKLSNTLISTICRIFILDSFFSILGLLYCDITLLIYTISGYDLGMGRFYFNMKREISGE